MRTETDWPNEERQEVSRLPVPVVACAAFASVVRVAFGGDAGHTVELSPGEGTLHIELGVLRPIADMQRDVEDWQETFHYPDNVLAAHRARGRDDGPPGKRIRN